MKWSFGHVAASLGSFNDNDEELLQTGVDR